MQTTALKDEAISLLDSLSVSKMRTVIQFARFIAQQPEDAADSTDETAVRAERDRRDVEIININADYLNAGAEENLEFQADIWEDEE